MAKHDKLALGIAKAVRTSDYFVLKYSSTERGKVVDVTVKDTDNNPYDLTELKISFVEELYNGNIIVDEDNFNTNADDLKNGKFSYQFRDEVYQYDGWAHFKFTKNENLIDTTSGFAIKINFDIDDDLDEKSYVVYFERIKKEHQDALNNLRELIRQAQSLNDENQGQIPIIKRSVNDVNQSLTDNVNTINQTIKDTKAELAKQINDEKSALSDRLDTLNNQKDALSGRVDTLTEEKTKLSQDLETLTGKNTDLTTKVDDLTSKNGELTEQLNNSKNEISELKSKVSTLETEASQHIKGKFDGFKSADEAKQWSEQNHGIAIFIDESDQGDSN